MLDVTFDIGDTLKKLDDIAKKQVPFATAVALTKTAKHVKAAQQDEMNRVFDRPTRWTLNALFVKAATKSNLTAKVWLKDYATKGIAATKYLSPQIFGKDRNLKGFEVLLQRRGILPKGYFIVPGRRCPLDGYGNIKKGFLNQVLSYSRAQRDDYQNTKLNTGRRSTKARFIVFPERNGMNGGIWQIKYGGLIPVLIFVKRPSYQIRYDFWGVAAKTIKSNVEAEFRKALKAALETAR